ncbi:aldehyde dehydrogenase family protein [Streptomyces iranensis]|uniref:Aldehyde Dehydrogenase n=1 Tax=Streptomyces iranensis TaxID=576784 RepID=A0A060ZJY3_9ACTN|nr:aldehyde dehydrogenase family protein [Streptomyces iranensis]MBP2063394.1 betaine-aldehyde dehydrogenase [Streptomyces iranensis]CDR01596.1 Aldehyde Dehydrogenase [Streptomyces iranensis]
MTFDIDPAQARRRVAELAGRVTGNFVDGSWISAGGERRAVHDPSTGEAIGYTSDSTAQDVAVAVEAANRAKKAWAAKTPSERSAALLGLAAAVEEQAEAFAVIESVDAGKPITAVVEEEVPGLIDAIRYFAGAARNLPAPSGGDYLAGYSSTMRREPVGVVAAITPWNYPLLQVVAKVVPAIATGNTVVVKPAEATPYSTARFAELAAQYLPTGVLNVVYGSGAVAGAALSEHPDVDLVSFTGSIETGRKVGIAAADGVKKAVMELGGNSPVLIFADAALEHALDAISAAALYNGGQECMSASRVIAHADVYERVVAGLTSRLEQVAVGDVLDPKTVLGPLITAEQRERVAAKVKNASDGTRITTGGDSLPGGGYFFAPTLVAGARQDEHLVQEEIFGPVITVQSFETESEALAMANGTRYGLASSVFTSDVATAARVQAELGYGTVWVNTHLVFGPDLPVSGFNASGVGTENSQDGLLEFTRLKHVMVDLA